MKTTTGKQTSSMNEARYSDLKRMLEERRKEILSEVQGRIRDQREADAWGKVNEVLDAGESSEADIQEDIEFALIQMKAETLIKINDALVRLEDGAYGYCSDCGGEISDKRLRALPFAVRCKDCEEGREIAVEREKVLAQKRNGPTFFFDVSN
jgi:RNA polymerase-binding transcription factor